MRVLGVLWAGLFGLIGMYLVSNAESAIHEGLAGIAWIIGGLGMVVAALGEVQWTINRLRKEMRGGTELMDKLEEIRCHLEGLEQDSEWRRKRNR